MTAMFTFIVVVAVAAFIPYVAAPGIANGVKAISSPSPAAASFDPAPARPAYGNDAANRIVSERGDNESAT
jgi:hypothetical protein